MLINKVKNTIKKYNMLSRDDRVLVCVSGGADSVCLLHLLNQLKDEYNLSLSVCHFDHMIRKESKKDLEFVEKLAAKFGLPFYSDSRDIPSFAKKNKISLEEAARNLRYEFFIKTAQKIGAKKVVVAHTRDDQAETVLMRVIRGAGLRGLSAIPPIRETKGILIIRPLIECKKKEIEAFLKDNKISWQIDPTNLKNIYFRNKIRNTLLPAIRRKFNPNINQTLSDLAETISADYDFINIETARAFKDCLLNEEKDEITLNIGTLKKFHRAIANMVIRKAIELIKGDLKKITFQNLNDINALFLKLGPNLMLDMPGRLRVIKEYKKLILTTKKEKAPKRKANYVLSVPGITQIPDLNMVFHADFIDTNGFDASTLLSTNPERSRRIDLRRHPRNEEYLDHDKLKFPVYVRFRKNGDSFRPIGMNREKKLKDFFIDEKLPALKREKTPLIVSGNDIVWVCGVRISEKFKVTDKTKNILKVSFVDKNNRF